MVRNLVSPLLSAAAAAADPGWTRGWLPEPLLRAGPRGLLWWQWGALPLLLVFGYLFGRLFAFVARRLIRPVLLRTSAKWDEELLDRMTGPIALAGNLLGVWLLLPAIDLRPSAQEFALQLLRAGLLVVLFWALLRFIELGAQLLARSPWASNRPATLALLPLGSRILKLAAFAMAAIAVLSELGYPVASLLAGLGIGGLAVALAAQKTLENLLGSVAISTDQPFRVGDFVRVEDVSGTVERVGLRSTQIRTLDRTIVTYPNGKLADMRSETFAQRDKIRLLAILNLGLDTRAQQVRAVLDSIEARLKSHPMIAEDAPSVRFSKIAAAALEIEIIAWFRTTDWNEFTLIRQDLLLDFMAIVEGAGAKLVLPSQEIHLAGAQKRA